MHSLKQTMPRALGEIVRRAPLSAGKVEFAWGLVVGPMVRRNTAIRLEAGVLHIDATSRQWADEIRRSSRTIATRLQALLGNAVTRLEVRTR